MAGRVLGHMIYNLRFIVFLQSQVYSFSVCMIRSENDLPKMHA